MESTEGAAAVAQNNMFEFMEVEDVPIQEPKILSDKCKVDLVDKPKNNESDGPLVDEYDDSVFVNDSDSSSESEGPPGLVSASETSTESNSEQNDSSSDSSSDSEPPGLVDVSNSSSDTYSSESDSPSDDDTSNLSRQTPTVAEVHMFSRTFFFDEEASEGSEEEADNEEVSGSDTDSADDDSDEKLLDCKIAKSKVKARLNKLKAIRMKQKRTELERAKKREAKAKRTLHQEIQLQLPEKPTTRDQSTQAKVAVRNKTTQTNLTVYQPDNAPDTGDDAEAAGVFQPLNSPKVKKRPAQFSRNRHSNHRIHRNPNHRRRRGRRGRGRGRTHRRSRPKQKRYVRPAAKRKIKFEPTIDAEAIKARLSRRPSKSERNFENRTRAFTSLDYKPCNTKSHQSVPLSTVEHSAGATTLQYRIQRNPLYDGPLRPFRHGEPTHFSAAEVEASAVLSGSPASTSTSSGGRRAKTSGGRKVKRSTNGSKIRYDSPEISTPIHESWSEVVPPSPTTENCTDSWSNVVPPSPVDLPQQRKISDWLNRPKTSDDDEWKEYARLHASCGPATTSEFQVHITYSHV